jgi:phosphatidylglycerophosphatase A
MAMHPGCRYSERSDPQVIVIDEIVGFLLANFLAPSCLTAFLCSLAFIDISKVSRQTE